MPGHRWRLAASTLGAPGTDVATVAGWIRAAGGDAVELRAAAGEPVHPGMSPGECRAVREVLAAAGVRVLALATYVRIAGDAPDAVVGADLAAHLDLAARLEAQFVRVFPGATTLPGASDEPPALVGPVADADARAVRRLAVAEPLARERGVRLVLETHDSHPCGADVARVLRLLADRVPGHRVGAVWDALHPWRVGEAPVETARSLRPHVAGGRGYVQIKDVVSADDLTPRLPGEGALPLRDVFAALTPWYDGPVSLEWERAWYPDAAPLPDALSAAAVVLA